MSTDTEVNPLEELRSRTTAQLDEMRQTLRSLQQMYGSPAVQIRSILEVIGDGYESVEILSPDKDVKPWSAYGGASGRSVAETGWQVRLSKGGGPLTVVNNYAEVSETQDATEEDDT